MQRKPLTIAGLHQRRMLSAIFLVVQQGCCASHHAAHVMNRTACWQYARHDAHSMMDLSWCNLCILI
jgi:hypothetical protein